MGSTPVIFAAKKGHKDVVLILTQKGANLKVVSEVSIYVDTTRKQVAKNKMQVFFLYKQ